MKEKEWFEVMLKARCSPCTLNNSLLSVYYDSFLPPLQPLLNLFHSEPGNGQWKRSADTALRHCKTIAEFLEETLPTIPDSVLDSAIDDESSNCDVTFPDVHNLLPPPYISKEEMLMHA